MDGRRHGPRFEAWISQYSIRITGCIRSNTAGTEEDQSPLHRSTYFGDEGEYFGGEIPGGTKLDCALAEESAEIVPVTAGQRQFLSALHPDDVLACEPRPSTSSGCRAERN